MKPIYKRKIWQLLHDVAKELKLASEHEINIQAKIHIDKAVGIVDKYVIDDMKRAERCQRGGKNANGDR